MESSGQVVKLLDSGQCGPKDRVSVEALWFEQLSHPFQHTVQYMAVFEPGRMHFRSRRSRPRYYYYNLSFLWEPGKSFKWEMLPFDRQKESLHTILGLMNITELGQGHPYVLPIKQLTLSSPLALRLPWQQLPKVTIGIKPHYYFTWSFSNGISGQTAKLFHFSQDFIKWKCHFIGIV